MKKFLISLCLVIMLVFSNCVYANSNGDLEGHWAKDTFSGLSSKKIVKGYEDGTFKPDTNMTRAEFISMLNRVMKFKGSLEISFKDVKKSDWFYEDLRAVFSEKLVTGYEDGTFLPNSKLTRAEAATIIARIIGDNNVGETDIIFADDKDIPGWAKKNIYLVVKNNIIKGYPDNSFKANNKITRAESTVVADRLITYRNNEDIEKKEVKVEKKVEKKLAKTNDLSTKSNDLSTKSLLSFPPSNSPKKVKSIELKSDVKNIINDGGSIELKVEYTPNYADNKDIEYSIKEGGKAVKVEKKSYDTLKLMALDNGKFSIEAYVKDTPDIKTVFNGIISNQVVGITGEIKGLSAGDKEIIGVTAGNIYILGLDNEFLSIDGKGMVISKHGTLNEAKMYASPINSATNKLTGLDNKMTYKVYKLNEEDLLNRKIDFYTKLKDININSGNIDEIQELEVYLDKAIDKKIQEFMSNKSKKQEWEEKKNKVETKKKELLNKIKEVNDEILESLNNIGIKIDGIQNKLTFEDIKSKVNEIDTMISKIPSKRHTEIPNEKLAKLEGVKSEIEQYEKFEGLLEGESFSLSDKGIVTIPNGLDPSFKLYVKYTTNSHNVGGSGVNIDTNTSFDFLNAIRKSGIEDRNMGNYCAELRYEKFNYLPMFVKESNVQELKYLTMFESLNLKGDLSINSDNTNGKILLDTESGKLTWDSIDNAEFYDIYASLTDRSNPSSIGKHYLKGLTGKEIFSGVNSIHDIEDLPLEEGEYGYFWPIVERGEFADSTSVRVAYRIKNKSGEKANSIDLSEFVPTSKGAVDRTDQILKENLNENIGVVIDIYIVPVNQSGLYITDEKNIENKKSIYIDNIKFEDFLEKFKIRKSI